MTEIKNNNSIYKYFHFRILNESNDLKPFDKLKDYFLILLFIFFIFLFSVLLVILIRRKVRKIMEKNRRIKLQNEINKIMMIDIFENRSPSLDSHSTEFHSINNDSILNDISIPNNILSEIKIQNDLQNSKDSNEL